LKRIARISALNALAFVTLIAACASSGNNAGGSVPSVHNELVRLMNESAVAWNRADLDGFLATYTRDAVFMGNPPTVGLDSIRARYVRGFFRDGRPTQQLAFDQLQTTMLGPNHALMTGRCILTNPADNKQSFCRFTLIWERRPEGWRMIHDHSS
jgi:beta-aspartyl-peptidase (threonine type)